MSNKLKPIKKQSQKELNFLNRATDLGLLFNQHSLNEYRARSIGLDIDQLSFFFCQETFHFQIRPFSKNYIEIIVIKK